LEHCFFIFADSLGRKLNKKIIFPDSRSSHGLFVIPAEKMQDLPIVRQIIVEAMDLIDGFYERIQNRSTVTATIANQFWSLECPKQVSAQIVALS
jgi:uncharacterized glyoxalase superfamily protein PhnB